jgi:hypothetical protein
MPVSKPYTFFLSHLAQYCSGTDIVYWIENIEPANNWLRPESHQENNLSFLITGNQAPGTISISIPTGVTLLDASATFSISAFAGTADAITQPIHGYNSTFSTPVLASYPALQASFTYSLTQVVWSNTYPSVSMETVPTGPYPDQNIKTVQVVQIPWWVDPTTYNQVGTGGTIFRALTADQDVTVDSTTFPQDLSGLHLTADRTLAYFNNTSTVVDEVQASGTDYQLTFEDVPQGCTTVTWNLNNSAISQLWIPDGSRGYLPASRLDPFTMGTAHLIETSLTILSLCELGEDELVKSILRELCFIRQQLDKQNAPIGLPTLLNRADTTFSLSNARDTLANAWLGLAVVHAVQNLRDRPATQIQSLPAGIDSLLKQLAGVVQLSVDPTTWATYTGFDSAGNCLTDLDLSATIVSSLFLHRYLSISYDQNVHEAAAKLYIASSRIRSLDEEELYPSPYQMPSLYKLLWNLVYGVETDTLPSLINQVTASVTATQTNDFIRGLWLYVLLLADQRKITTPTRTVSNHFISWSSTLPSLYYFQTSSGLAPELVPTFWMSLLSIPDADIFIKPMFNLHAYDALSFSTFVYLECCRMFPFGYRWPGVEDLYAYTGRIGSLFYAIAHSTFGWYLMYAMANDSLTIHTSQGWAVDQWLALYGLSRDPFQSDDFSTALLIRRISTVGSTLEGLYSAASLYGVTDIEILDPQILSYRSGSSSPVTWNNSPDDHTALSTDGVQLTIPAIRYPTLLPLSSTKEVSVANSPLSTLTIYARETAPEVDQLFKEFVPAGVGLNYTVVLTSAETLSSRSYFLPLRP